MRELQGFDHNTFPEVQVLIDLALLLGGVKDLDWNVQQQLH